MRFWTYMLFALLLTVSAQAQVRTLAPIMQKGAPFKVEIYPVTETIVPQGMLSYYVLIENSSKSPVKYTIEARFESGWGGSNGVRTAEQTDTFEVPAGSSQTFVSRILLTNTGNRRWGNQEVKFFVNGPYVSSSHIGGIYYNRSNRDEKAPFIGYIGDIYGRIGAAVENANKNKINFGHFDSDYLPVSANGYASWDALIIDAVDWRQLATESREALLTWVQFGGQLAFDMTGSSDIVKAEIQAMFGLKKVESVRSYGLGQVHMIAPYNKNQWRRWILDNTMHRPVWNRHLSQTRVDWVGDRWESYMEEEPVTINAILISIYMFVFAIVIGPVNFIKLAPAKRRFRIFVTTPIISLIASVLLIMTILIGDGMGGTSRESVLVYLDSDKGRMLVDQRAIVRSRLLFNTSIESDAAKEIVPLEVNGHFREGNANYFRKGSEYSGSYLANRNWQALGTRFVEPTRSEIRVESLANGDMEIFSSVSAKLDDVLYIDEQGATWHAQGVGQGGRQTLVRADGAKTSAFWKDIEERYVGTQREQLRRWSKNARDIFIAKTSTVSEIEAIDLPAVSLLETVSVLCGSVKKGGAVQ